MTTGAGGDGGESSSQEKGGGRKSHASGASTPTPGGTDDVTRVYALLPTDAPILILPTAAHEWESEQEATTNVLDNDLGHKTPDLFAGPEPSTPSRPGTVAERPAEEPSEHVHERDRMGEDMRETARWDKSGGE